MVAGVIGEEVFRIVCFTCSGKCYVFSGRNADICAAGEGPKLDGRQIAAVCESMRQMQVIGARRFCACGRIGIDPCIPGNDRGTGDADLTDTGPVVAFHVYTAAIAGFVYIDRVFGDRAAVQIQCAFCTHIDTAAVTGGCVIGDRAAIHVHRAFFQFNAAAMACTIAVSQCAAVHVERGIFAGNQDTAGFSGTSGNCAGVFCAAITQIECGIVVKRDLIFIERDSMPVQAQVERFAVRQI